MEIFVDGFNLADGAAKDAPSPGLAAAGLVQLPPPDRPLRMKAPATVTNSLREDACNPERPPCVTI